MTVDELPVNNRYERTHHLYPFADAAPATGLDNDGKGWAGAFADYDNDGDLDLYVSNGGSAGSGPNALYRNEGDSGFSNVTEQTGVSDEGNGTGVVFADFDRDGHQDLFIAKGGFGPPEANRLFHNNGDGTFADISASAGLDAEQSSYAPAVGDFDRDGFLDLYVSQLRSQESKLYRNEGDGTFADVSRTNVISSSTSTASAAAFGDYDNDGEVDLYASFFGTRNVYYDHVGDSAAVYHLVGQAQGLSMGVAQGELGSNGV